MKRQYTQPTTDVFALRAERYLLETSYIPVVGPGGFDGGEGDNGVTPGGSSEMIGVGGSGSFDTRAMDWLDEGWY